MIRLLQALIRSQLRTLAVLLLIPADIEFLASIYAFGATISFTIVHLSVIRLRWREPDRDRPFKIPINPRLGRGEGLRSLADAAVEAVERAGTEVSATRVAGRDRGPAGAWAQLRHRVWRRTEHPTDPSNVGLQEQPSTVDRA